jgi:hypothetical protein
VAVIADFDREISYNLAKKPDLLLAMLVLIDLNKNHN